MTNVDNSVYLGGLPTPLDSPVKDKSVNLPPIYKDATKMSLNFKNSQNDKKQKEEFFVKPKQSLSNRITKPQINTDNTG